MPACYAGTAMLSTTVGRPQSNSFGKGGFGMPRSMFSSDFSSGGLSDVVVLRALAGSSTCTSDGTASTRPSTTICAAANGASARATEPAVALSVEGRA